MLPEEEDDHAISIHALREEGDRKKPVHDKIAGRFLSTPSARRATDYRLVRLAKFDISIHALREEGDASSSDDFQTRSGFLSTPSARRATAAHTAAGTASHNFYPRPPRGGRRHRMPP